MIRDRIFAEDAQRRSPCPRHRRRSRDLDLSKNSNYPPETYRVAVDYSLVGGKSPRVKTTERRSRDSYALGRRVYDDCDIGRERDRDGHMVGSGRSTSPRRYQCRGDFDVRSPRGDADIERRRTERDSDRYTWSSPILNEQRDDFDRDACIRSVRQLGSYEAGNGAIGFHSGISRRSYEEPHCRDRLLGNSLDRYETYDRVSVRDYTSSRYVKFGENNLTREEDHLKINRRLDSSHGGQLLGPSPLEYEIGGSILDSAHGDIHMSSVTSSHLGGDQEDFHLHVGPRRDKIDATYRDRDGYFEKKYAEFYLQDELLLGIENRMGKGTDNDGKVHNIQSPHDYLSDDHSYYISSSPHPKDFPSASSLSMLREDFPCYNSSEYGQLYSPKSNGSNHLFEESPHKRHTREVSRKMFPYSEARLTPDEVGAYGSVRARRRDLELSRDVISYRKYGSETPCERYDVKERSERFMRYKHDEDETPCECVGGGGYQISIDENGVREIRRASTDMVVLRHHSDVEKIRRPVSSEARVSRRLKKCRTSAKKRSSATAPWKKRGRLPWLENMTSNWKSY